MINYLLYVDAVIFNIFSSFLSLLANIENLPSVLHSLAVDGNARKEKGSGKKKKRQSEKNGNEAKKKLR